MFINLWEWSLLWWQQLYSYGFTIILFDEFFFFQSNCNNYFLFFKIACTEGCLTCYGGNDNQCLSCPNGKVLESGSCLTNCFNGNYPDSESICQGIYFIFSKIYFVICFYCDCNNNNNNNNKLGCQYPCSTCFGPENGECLSCISPTIRNGTTCISESQCNQNGFIDSNRNCQGFSLLLRLFVSSLSIFFQKKKKKKRMWLKLFNMLWIRTWWMYYMSKRNIFLEWRMFKWLSNWFFFTSNFQQVSRFSLSFFWQRKIKQKIFEKKMIYFCRMWW